MIKIEHLVKNYGTLCALDDVNIEIGNGEIIGLLGPNGAGKSTMMNILTGYLSSSGGKVEIDGADVADNPMEAKKKIGYLPEQPPLYPDMTVLEYLRFVYELKKCKLNRDAHLSEICATVKIGDVANRLIKNLSKGYRQRVGIAEALVGDPELIIFDEPTVGLDPKQIIEVRNLIRTLGKRHTINLSKGYRQRVGIAQALIGNPPVIVFDEPTVGLDPKQIIEIRNLIRTLGKDHTVILSTHILQEVQAVCDRIIIINNGRIVADEKAENITRAVSNLRRVTAKICGPSKDVLSAIRAMSGVANVELMPQKDGDANVYVIESDPGVDIRKNLFYEMAGKRFPIVGLENVGMQLEDIFLAVVDAKGEDGGKRKKGRAPRRTAESELARQIMANAESNSKTE